MKQTFCLILIFFSYLSFSQEYYDMDMTREKPKLKDYYLKTISLIDSTEGKPYISLTQVFDKEGKHKMGYQFNRNGDTIQRIESIYPDILTEIHIHSFLTGISDTAIYKYNNRNQQTVEIWKWGEDKTIDTIKFFYDKKHRLVANFEIYDFGTFRDSLFYVKNKLIKSITYDGLDVTNSVYYHYEKNKIIGIKKYNNLNELISDYQFEIGNFDKPRRVTNIFKSYNSKDFDKKTITDYDYYDKNQIKSKIIRFFENGKLEKTTELYYSEHGHLKESKTTNSEGKTINAKKITLHNNGS